MAIYFGQDIATKLTQADAYFDMHILKHDWAKVTDGDKQIALQQAEREVDLYLGMDLEESYDETSFPITGISNFRPDYAIFEHAYFLLDNTARTEASSDGVKRIESEDYQKEERTGGVPLAPQAQRYLRMNRLQICRG